MTDPPYSSGGIHAGARQAPSSQKYQNTGTQRTYDELDGDNRDQRSWTRWCEMWLRMYRELGRGDTYAMVFSDWRQLPALTDAAQMAGWIWRGVAVWDKGLGSRAPHPGYFRHQAEFVVWGTAGKLPRKKGRRIQPGVLAQSVDSRKIHMTQKPVRVAEWLCSLPDRREDSVIVDPFAGVASIALGADMAGHESISCERSPAICSKALGRLLGAGWTIGAPPDATVSEGDQ